MQIIADNYEVLGVLGEGGTGIVYDAVRKSDGRAVALKVMHESLAGDQQIRGRFQREAAILRRLEGDHVCAILDFGEVPGEEDGTTLLYIAMPKIDGEALSQILQRGPLEVGRALDIMHEVLAALRAAHAQGVIHRDLKPANVLIDEHGKVTVVDFGMSKIITGTGTGTTNLTAHNMLFGTPEYMSPEQARGDELDARCDVYAAGVMLHELLTGEPPFTGATPLGVLTAHLTSDLVPPSKVPGGKGRITPAIEAVIVHALARDRDQRYASAGALSAAIAHARSAPDDVEAVRPAAFSAAPAGTDAFAATMPSSDPAAVAQIAALVQAGIDPTAPTMLLASTLSSPPSAVPSAPVPSRAPSRVSLRPDPPAATRGWILLWILVAIASMALGAWFALRH